MTKIIHTAWSMYGREIGEELPALCGRDARKVAITTVREGGASRQQQEDMARQMGHNVTTADRYYDKSKRQAGRQKVMEDLNKLYEV